MSLKGHQSAMSSKSTGKYARSSLDQLDLQIAHKLACLKCSWRYHDKALLRISEYERAVGESCRRIRSNLLLRIRRAPATSSLDQVVQYSLIKSKNL